MRTGALVIGMIGGVVGILSAVIALVLGGIGGAVEAEGANTIVGLGWAALIFSFLGILGAGLALAKPRIAALILLVSTVGITISISLFAIIAAPLMLIAGILAFFGRYKYPEAVSVKVS